MRILCLCYANRWRSPLAAALLAREGFLVRSAGFQKPGLRAGKPVREAAKKLGLDLEEHRSQIVTQEIVNWAELIVLMNDSHVERLRKDCVLSARVTTVKLGYYAQPAVPSIKDLAFLQGREFDAGVEVIQTAVAGLAKELKNAS